MNRKETIRIYHQEQTLQGLGFTLDEARALRRISMTLRRWFELECGDSNGYASWAIERDEATNKPYMVRNLHSGKSFSSPVADRETGARKRLNKILAARNARSYVNGKCQPENGIGAYVQTDPRGAALYILRPGDIPEGADVSAYYTRGICVY